MITLFIPENHYIVRKTDYVLESLRTSILLGYIPPGTSITEKQIRDVLKVSSSPIREALNQLEAEGLLTRSPHVGTKVAEIVIEDARELYSIQALLQSSAVQICANKLSEADIRAAEKLNSQIGDMLQSNNVDLNSIKMSNYQFHMTVCGASVYPWLTRLISALWLRLPNRTIWTSPKEAKAAIRYHAKILTAIKKGNARLAGDLMKKHLQRSQQVLYGSPQHAKRRSGFSRLPPRINQRG